MFITFTNPQKASEKPLGLSDKDDAPSDTVCKPPFDIFGMQLSFMINGEDKTITWLGFVSSIILVSAVIAVSVFQGIYFYKNEESSVYINDIVLNGSPTVELNNTNFIMMVRHIYPQTGPLYG